MFNETLITHIDRDTECFTDLTKLNLLWCFATGLAASKTEFHL